MSPGRHKVVLRALCSAVLLMVLFWLVDWRQSLPVLQQVRALPVLLAIPLFPLGIWLSSLKWQALLKAHGVRSTTAALFRMYWVGIFLGNFLPSSVGGDIGRVALWRHSGRLAEVAASIVLERLTGVFVVLVMCGFALYCRPHFFEGFGLLPLFRVVVAGALLALLLTAALGGRLNAWLSRLQMSEHSLPTFIAGKAKKLVSAVLFYRGKKVAIGQCILLSLGFYLLVVLAQYLFVVALEIDVSFWDVVFIVPLINLVSMLPVSLNAIGIAEGAFVVFFSRAGVPPSEALALALLVRILQTLLSSVGGLFLLTEEPKR